MSSGQARNQSASNSAGIFAYQMSDARKAASGSGCVNFYQPNLAPRNQQPVGQSGHVANDTMTSNACAWGDDVQGNSLPLFVGTRVKKGCNTLSGVFIPQQFDPMVCDRRAYRLQSNSVIGLGSRNSVKDGLFLAMNGSPSPFTVKK